MNHQDSFPQGLTSEEAKSRQAIYGKNEPIAKRKRGFIRLAFHTVREPMFLLLMAVAVIYFILGEPRDGAIMLVFVAGIITIDILQEWKTDKTLNALKDLSAPHVTVLRDGVETTVASADLVPGDLMLLHEGDKIPADGAIIRCSDLRVDESSLTGEAEAVWKEPEDSTQPAGDIFRKDICYAGTLVTQGSAAVLVEKIGASTEYGKIGGYVAEAPDRPTPLEKQTGKLVKLCTGIAALLFVLVAMVTWFNIPDHAFAERLIESVLSGITLAMAMIPEEFPVVLTVFLSMGAWRLAKKRSLVRRLSAVETLGAVSVLCVDKTGTITMNRMTVNDMWSPRDNIEELNEIMGLACETETYDPMEQAMLAVCEEAGFSRGHLFGGELLTEYAFTNELKMMGHVWRHDGELLVAAKGSPERLLPLCELDASALETAWEKVRTMSEQGLRVIAVSKMSLESDADIPPAITDCRLTLMGLVGLADPPREGVAEDIATCTRAGIRVIMITGDNGITAASIARQVGISQQGEAVTGDMLEKMSDEELCDCVKTTNVFSRVIPEHKMRIVKAFKQNGEVVAMTGDGVNDAPALKYADIGIAMGKRGSEVSREAADLILMDDNFTTIVETIRDGRRIHDNIRKAIGYIFTIHIPIALSSLIAPLLGIAPGDLLLLPLHVVLLELIIDPTCSIALERQPEEENIMSRPPRNPKEKLLDAYTLMKSVIQGVVLFAASFGTYFYMLRTNGDSSTARAMGLSILMLSNLLLVQVNSSNRDSLIHSFRRLVHDKVMWATVLGTLTLLLVILYTPLHAVLDLAPLPLPLFMAALGVAAVAVLWYEIVKWIKSA